MHRPRGVVFRRIQRSEIVEVVLDLGAVGDIETDRTEERFDALDRARHRMQAARRQAPARQRDVERLRLELRLQRGMTKRLAPRIERRLDPLLGAVYGGTRRLACLRIELAQPLQQLGNRAALAEKARLGLLQRRGVFDAGKFGRRLRD